ncbi:MAG: DUF2721 domain-containing protein [Chloroflexi bacterium]|nr:DUF2721 domain-containing protein [Chloroflexota bacterium]OQA94508.1 MAG: hypothetical protein BWY25_02758 [Chloroflexi bacterium ADurb.Bin222]HOC20407.1 DUF2721 domain-containing protein [Anaerolineae bacterium]HOS80698.1 DUF2721 domain-containing protein [Anaerolineae bacterium]HQE99796.1 DUF2721 domain-containing protein [Anaerolineae bacterium]
MELTLTTPALLFPALSLLMLAYTNRFLTLASLIRELHRRYQTEHEPGLAGQLNNLRRRVLIIRDMQAFGIASLFGCVLSMFLLFAGQLLLGEIVFGVALLLMLISLGLSFWEILISVEALRLQLHDMEP